MRAGITVEEFWALTPKETHLAIRAASWRAEQRQREIVWQAWHTAAFMRAKRMPAYAEVIKPKQAQRLSQSEKEQKRVEFDELKARFEDGTNSGTG